MGPGLQRRHGQGAARGRARGHRRGRAHGLPGDPRPPGGDAAPEGARRDPGRPAQPRPPGRHGRVRHRPHRPGGVEPLPLRLEHGRLRARRHPGRGAHRHRRAGDDPGGGQELQARRRRSPTRPTTPVVVEELQAGGVLSDATKRALARKAFAHTAAYDASIVAWFDEGAEDPLPRHPPPRARAGAGAALRREPAPDRRPLPQPSAPRSWWDDVEQHGGMALSYLNLFDADAAWGLANDLAALDRPAGRGHHQARQPVRRGRGRLAGRRLPAGLRVRRAVGVRRHRRAVAPGRRRHGGRAWSPPPRPTS